MNLSLRLTWVESWAFKALTKEKQSLLEADNKGLKDVVAWQEKTKNLTVLNAQLVDELKKYRDVESRLQDCLDELSKKDSLVSFLKVDISFIQLVFDVVQTHLNVVC